MAGAAKKRAKQSRSDKSTAQGTGETLVRAESIGGDTQVDVPSGFDGPGDPRPGSLTSATPSHGSGPLQPGVVQPVLRDPARQPEYNRNIDLPGNAYNLFSQVSLHVIV